MKASGSPCPLDKISIIPFKRCTYLRSYITEVIRLIWISCNIPDEWKKACTVLIHKKGDTSDPGNFKPITFESVPLKIFTSFLRDSTFSFVSSNGYIEHKIQKGFLPKLTGTFYHNLIPEVLRYHHIPQHIQNMVQSLYCNFHTSILTTSYQTPFLKVRKGVLQDDCLSPLTFNLCFNTFIKYISDPMFSQFGFTTSTLSPLHWFQFANDAAVVTGHQQENQTLLNLFTRWCTWENMVIRVDKCVSFGIKKSSASSTQFLPKLIINRKLVPVFSIGESFKYLGRYFNFSMDNSNHMSILLETTHDLMTKLDQLPCHPKYKLSLYHRLFFQRLHGT